MSQLYQHHFLRLLDFTPADIAYLLTLAAELKQAKKAGNEPQTLKGKNIALIFEKDSTRTRCSFEVAAYDQGANVTYLGSNGSQIGHKESIKDSARVLGRMYAGSVCRSTDLERAYRRIPSNPNFGRSAYNSGAYAKQATIAGKTRVFG